MFKTICLFIVQVQFSSVSLNPEPKILIVLPQPAPYENINCQDQGPELNVMFAYNKIVFHHQLQVFLGLLDGLG